MNDDAKNDMLLMLGRRVERMLFGGIILIILFECLIFVSEANQNYSVKAIEPFVKSLALRMGC